MTGPDSEKVIVREIGPSLVNYGITNPLQNQTLELRGHTGAAIATAFDGTEDRFISGTTALDGSFWCSSVVGLLKRC